VEAGVFLFDQAAEAAGEAFADGRIEQAMMGAERFAAAGLVDVQQREALRIAGEADAAFGAAFGFEQAGADEALDDLGEVVVGKAEVLGDFRGRAEGAVAGVGDPQAGMDRDREAFGDVEQSRHGGSPLNSGTTIPD
jgi:hypothetical protein